MHLLFDLDGTLSNPEEGVARSLKYTLKSVGLPEPPIEGLGWCVCLPAEEALAKLLGRNNSHLMDRAMRFYRARHECVGVFENAIYPGVEQVLLDLVEEGHALILATAKPTVQAQRIIEDAGLVHLFDAIYGSEPGGALKDKGELIAYVLEQENLGPEEVLMIGDRARDIVGARQNRVAGVGVLWGFGSKKELFDAGAIQCVQTPEELGVVVSKVVQENCYIPG